MFALPDPQYNRMLAAIGDVHGCYEQLEELLKIVTTRFDNEPSILVMLGDYVDRGEDSKKVLEIFRNWNNPHVELVLIKGNHDEMMIESTLRSDKISRRKWLCNDGGGKETVKSFESQDDLKDFATWMDDTLIDSCRIGDLMFVHAGINPYSPLNGQTARYLRWDRAFSEHGPQTYPENITVIHGHVIVDRPIQIGNRIAIDTGCVFGMELSAAFFNDDSKLLGFESVSYY